MNENENVIFMCILISEPNEELIQPGQNGTVVSIQSKLTRKLLSVRGKDLVADTDQLSDNQKFLVYYGLNDIIGLKSMANGRFVGAHSGVNQPLVVNRNRFGTPEMFKVVEVIEKYSFPKVRLCKYQPKIIN
jgi:hypothetical protein